MVLSGALSAYAGEISAPTSGVVVAEGDSFAFAFQDSNWCEDGYSEITVWLTDYAPTTADLTAGVFPEGDYTYSFGSYLIPNFGLPVLSGSTPPPPSLVMPELTSLVTGEDVYLAVVETGNNCPPGLNVPPQYEVTAAPMTIG
ncbi:hypothetical protein BT96DRAFT_926940 [Gymnopus androsaceus JB14]|uniref:Uncharacterized protein n=1 Tax=Gymnopus androsaceus JB14 TaxID=1447944 RepID=A0A6A4GU67_9AGAR|nr:hypothetical protein BT96DRAFT_926940 [Gymnopus androsaceus JB14]